MQSHTASKWAAQIQTQVVWLVWPLFNQDLNALTLSTIASDVRVAFTLFLGSLSPSIYHLFCLIFKGPWAYNKVYFYDCFISKETSTWVSRRLSLVSEITFLIVTGCLIIAFLWSSCRIKAENLLGVILKYGCDGISLNIGNLLCYGDMLWYLLLWGK